MRKLRTEELDDNCLIIARIDFTKERVGHGAHFIKFLAQIAVKYRYNVSN